MTDKSIEAFIHTINTQQKASVISESRTSSWPPGCLIFFLMFQNLIRTEYYESVINVLCATQIGVATDNNWNIFFHYLKMAFPCCLSDPKYDLSIQCWTIFTSPHFSGCFSRVSERLLRPSTQLSQLDTTLCFQVYICFSKSSSLYHWPWWEKKNY